MYVPTYSGNEVEVDPVLNARIRQVNSNEEIPQAHDDMLRCYSTRVIVNVK
jgi:hypothetical protein